MKISILTLFPEQIDNFLSFSIIGRAIEKGILEIKTINIRDFAVNEYGKVDDTLYGGGTGMLIMCQPVYDAYNHAVQAFHKGSKPHTIFVSPKGKTLSQKISVRLSKHEDICIICGHYEGIDQRVLDLIVDEEISIGDYVLTGGEIAAIVIVDSMSRMIDGVLPSEDAYTNESHMNGLLEANQYTKPYEWNGIKIPEVLASGHEALIREENYISSIIETIHKRPDMLQNNKNELSETTWKKVLDKMKE